jgi:DNA-binding GntR family transcriptional regulator
MNLNPRSQKIEIQLLSNRVYDFIKTGIINLSYKPGEQLIERRLTAELGVSKSPIRDALQRLERENLVYMIPFKGSYVANVSKEQYEEMHQVREALEVYCLSRGLTTYTEEEIIQKFGNKLIENIYSNLSDKIKRYINIAEKHIPSRVKLANEEHRDLLKTIEEKDVTLAVNELKSHLSKVLDAFLNCDAIKDLK